MTGEGCACGWECGRGHSLSAQAAAAAEGGGGPDGPRPMRPHPSAAHADQRRARHNGRNRPRTNGSSATTPAHGRQGALLGLPADRYLLIRVLAPSSRNKAQKPALAFTSITRFRISVLSHDAHYSPSLKLTMKNLLRDHAPARPPLFQTLAPLPAESVTNSAAPPRVTCCRTWFDQRLARPLPAPLTHILGVDVCPNRHQRLRRLRVASSSRRVQGRFSLRGGRRVRLVGG